MSKCVDKCVCICAGMRVYMSICADMGLYMCRNVLVSVPVHGDMCVPTCVARCAYIGRNVSTHEAIRVDMCAYMRYTIHGCAVSFH